ncbi:MAG: alpha/beta fold hydrolase [Acidobacteria bacterium]|nr:alpha/beta fold hydrolase [Acidobacteriota bacterium]MBV9475492.1 alpha/beta fold hydrolase [Acidobacteriota bacterium]
MIRTLSGFLGLASDWDFLPWPHVPYDGTLHDDDVLIGYSMGGRLALRALETQRVAKAVIVSAGLNAPDDERVRRDEEWARRFETDAWPSLMRDWNAQPVFGGHVVERREEDYDRRELARMLRESSPAVLPPPRLESIETPLLWIAGARDAKYVDVAQRAVARLPHAELWVCPDAGHRVPWEQPERFVARLRTFLRLQ